MPERFLPEFEELASRAEAEGVCAVVGLSKASSEKLHVIQKGPKHVCRGLALRLAQMLLGQADPGPVK